MSAEAEICRRIQARGAITFAEFMELALFWPDGGYYVGSERIGSSGDFYTSPLAHPAFGALLAVQLFQMWQIMGQPSPFTVVELGAGNGLLCRDLMSYSVELPDAFSQSLRYLCLDRRAFPGVERTPVTPSLLIARIAATGVPLRGIHGCFLSNEFLDAFPVHQVTVREGRLLEVYVTQRSEELVETLAKPSTPGLAARLAGLGVALAEGQIAEINLGLEAWAREVSAALEEGFVLTIDYGQAAADLYSTQRHRGTLTSFYRHTQTDAPLRQIGRQDITAQVDFTSVVNAGCVVGLEPLGFTRQREFLFNLGLGQLQQRLSSVELSHRQLQANRAGMLDLARPQGLGDFKVLAQVKNVRPAPLSGFEPSAEAASLASGLPVPLLTAQHLSLLEGRYPHAEFEFELESLWPFEGDRSGRPSET